MKKIIKTHCGRMDHGGCTLWVEVEDGRIVSLRPDPEGDLSHGYMCSKARALPELLNHPQRLRHPLRRQGERGSGRFEEISWPEALEFAAQGFNRIKEKHGARAVAFCQGSPKGLEHFVLIRLANTFGSPNLVGPQNVCHMPREIAGIHTCGFFPVPDYGHPSEAVLVWGSNLTATNEEGVICTGLLRRLKEDSPTLIVVDPRKTELAQRADFWLPVKPGTDLALALGFLNVIITEGLYDQDFVQQYTYGFDELAEYVRGFPPEVCAAITGVEQNVLRQAARVFGRARPGLVQWGNGIEQNIHNFDTSRALIFLMALGGSLDAPGGTGAPSPPPVIRLAEFVRADLLPGRAREMLSAPYSTAPGFVIVPPEYFKRAVLTGEPYPMRGAYVHVSNPVLAWSDSRGTYEALKALDFLVVTETFLSPTAALADLVLPGATHLEFNDLGHFGLGHGFVLARPKVVDPPPECWPPTKILNELAKALGLAEFWWEDYEEMLGEILAPSGLSYADLAERGILRGPERFYKYKQSGFKTSTGKLELILTKGAKAGLNPLPVYDGPPEPEDPEFPLLLTGHKSRNFFCSDHRYLQALVAREPEPLVELHPETGAAAGIEDGMKVVVETRNGRVKVQARLTENIRPGILSLVHGWWKPDIGADKPGSWAETTLNVLTSGDKLNRALGTPNLRGLPAAIRPL